jgi:hypothetical protein
MDGRAALLLPRMPNGAKWNGLVLMAGCRAIFVASVIRSTRKSKPIWPNTS